MQGAERSRETDIHLLGKKWEGGRDNRGDRRCEQGTSYIDGEREASITSINMLKIMMPPSNATQMIVSRRFNI